MAIDTKSIWTVFKPLSKLTLIFITAALSACSEEEPSLKTQFDDLAFNEPYLGPLEEATLAVTSHRRAEACDQKEMKMRLEIAHALDSRSQEISRYGSEHPPEGLKKVEVGPTYFLEKEEPRKQPPNEWREWRDSWSRVYSLYEKILETPTDRNWVILNRSARSLISDDIHRVILIRNYGLGRGDGSILKTVIAHLEACLKNTNCIRPAFSEEIELLLVENAIYQAHWEIIKTEKNATIRRKEIRFLLKRIKRDAEYYEFIPNPHMRQIKKGDESTFILSLDAGDLKGGEKKLTEMIESTWKSETHQVQVEWETREESGDDLFSIFLDLDYGSRAYVRYEGAEMHLSEGTRVVTFVHEVGHILGFPDLYYTRWDSKNCEYATEINPGNIMSLSSGSVTEELWNELSESYPSTPH